MSAPFEPRPSLELAQDSKVLLVRSAAIGDFLVCVPFIDHLVRIKGLNPYNIGFLIFNASGVDPVSMVFGKGFFPIENILIMSPSAQGVLCSLRKMRELAARFDRIWYLPFQTEGKPSIQKKRWAYRLGFGARRHVEGLMNFEGPHIRPSQYLSLFDIYGLHYDNNQCLSFLNIHCPETTAVDAFLAALPGPLASPLIAVYPHSKLKMKVWPQPYFIALISELRRRHNATIILIGADEDLAYHTAIMGTLNDPRVVDAAGKFTVRQTIYLLSKVDLLIGNDGAPLHMGALAGAPVLGLYTRKAPIGMWDPVVSPNMVTLQHWVPCENCLRATCAAPVCIQQIPVELVTRVATKILSGDSTQGSYTLEGPAMRLPCHPLIKDDY